MTHPWKWAPALVLLAPAAASGQSYIAYYVEVLDDFDRDIAGNHIARWEAGERPLYTVSQDLDPIVCFDVEWAVRVHVGGIHDNPGGPGHGKAPLGAARLEFRLVLTDMHDNVIQIGAAPMTCEDAPPSQQGPLNCRPTGAGFWSSINDGDVDGLRGQISGPDERAMAAFAISLAPENDQGYRIIDPFPGPNFDLYQYPSAAGWPPGSTTDPGFLEGFEAGYGGFDFGVTDRAGVGMDGPVGTCGEGLGAGLPLFEGQISIAGPAFQPNTMYKLKVLADAAGNEILHGDVDCAAGNLGGWDTLSTPPNFVFAGEIAFSIPSGCAPPPIFGRHLFYNNSYHDGNNAGINTEPNGGTNHDHDDDAIDRSKFPLLPGDGLAWPGSWTGYTQGINGLMFDLGWPQEPPVTAAHFTFTNTGRFGTGNTPVTPSGFAVRPGAGIDGTDRVVITFPDGLLVDTWLKVEIGTGFGLPFPDICWWGNAVADCGTAQGYIILVDGTDILGPRDHIRSILNRALVSDLYDYNKDSLVNGVDVVLARDHPKHILNAVRTITS